MILFDGDCGYIFPKGSAHVSAIRRALSGTVARHGWGSSIECYKELNSYHTYLKVAQTKTNQTQKGNVPITSADSRPNRLNTAVIPKQSALKNSGTLKKEIPNTSVFRRQARQL